jgi:hypothetical protein
VRISWEQESVWRGREYLIDDARPTQFEENRVASFVKQIMEIDRLLRIGTSWEGKPFLRLVLHNFDQLWQKG